MFCKTSQLVNWQFVASVFKYIPLQFNDTFEAELKILSRL